MPDREEGLTRQREVDGANRNASVSTDIAALAVPPGRLEVDYLKSVLSRVVNADLVPRLVLAEKTLLQNAGEAGSDGIVRRSGVSTPTKSEVSAFQVLVLYRDTYECFEFINALRERGVSLADLYLGLFTPLARELGSRWENDSLSFVDVTKAIGRLQSLVHTFSDNGAELHPLDAAHKIVLASPPQEQHVLGMLIVSKLFEMEGWSVSGGPSLHTGRPLNELVHGEWFGVVGLTASTEDHAIELKRAIDQLRKSSCNDTISVIVGGHGFDEHPELSKEIGADELVTDGEDAVTKAEKLISTSDADGQT